MKKIVALLMVLLGFAASQPASANFELLVGTFCVDAMSATKHIIRALEPPIRRMALSHEEPQVEKKSECLDGLMYAARIEPIDIHATVETKLGELDQIIINFRAAPTPHVSITPVIDADGNRWFFIEGL